VQALGFNPAPQFSNNSDKETVDASGKITSEYQPVHQYFSADDIEEEIVRERGPAEPPMRVAQPLDVEGGRQAQSASPFAQVIASYGQAPTEATQPRPQVPAAQAPYAQDPRSQSSARMPSVASPSAGAKDDQDDQGPDLSSVPEIETARIWEQRTSKEILMGILKAKKAEYAVALFASTDGAVQGEMLVVKSVVIHGAKLVEPDLSGYEALKVMLAIPHGTYTLLDVTDYVESAQQLEQGLSVRITPLANALPNLPDSVDELMGASQISRIRSKGPVDLEAAVAPPKPPKPLTIGERLPSTKMMVLIAFTILALIMMLVVLYVRR
jgi:hypothetical protein